MRVALAGGVKELAIGVELAAVLMTLDEDAMALELSPSVLSPAVQARAKPAINEWRASNFIWGRVVSNAALVGCLSV